MIKKTIFKVFGMTQPGIEPRSPGPLADTLPTNNMEKRWLVLKNRKKMRITFDLRGRKERLTRY